LCTLLLAGVSRLAHRRLLPGAADAAAMVAFSPELTPTRPWQRHIAAETILPPVAPDYRALHPLLVERNSSLDNFYAALWRTESHEPGAITRILHYGDSPTTADLITGDSRQLLQSRYGDAGHGFTLIGKPWAWYEHRGVELSGRGWQMDPGTRWDMRNGLFGLGGVLFTGSTGAFSRVTLRDPGQTRLEVWYLREPGGGSLEVTAGGRPIGEIATAADTRTPGYSRFDLAPGASTMEFAVTGPVRLFGITVEKPRAGVVYDSIGLNGETISMPALIFNESH